MKQPTEIFDSWEYAADNWGGETLNFMTEEEKSEIWDIETKEELVDYLHRFYERT